MFLRIFSHFVWHIQFIINSNSKRSEFHATTIEFTHQFSFSRKELHSRVAVELPFIYSSFSFSRSSMLIVTILFWTLKKQIHHLGGYWIPEHTHTPQHHTYHPIRTHSITLIQFNHICSVSLSLESQSNFIRRPLVLLLLLWSLRFVSFDSVLFFNSVYDFLISNKILSYKYDNNINKDTRWLLLSTSLPAPHFKSVHHIHVRTVDLEFYLFIFKNIRCNLLVISITEKIHMWKMAFSEISFGLTYDIRIMTNDNVHWKSLPEPKLRR